MESFRPGKREYILPYYLHRFRDAIVIKFTEFLDPNGDSLRGASRYFKKKLRRMAREILPELQHMETKNETLNAESVTIGGF
jgi:hypothetical protein